MAQILSMEENFAKIDSFKFDVESSTRIKNIIKVLYEKENDIVIIEKFDDGVYMSRVGQFYDTNIEVRFKC